MSKPTPVRFTIEYTYRDTQRCIEKTWISGVSFGTHAEATAFMQSNVFSDRHETLTGKVVEVRHA